MTRVDWQDRSSARRVPTVSQLDLYPPRTGAVERMAAGQCRHRTDMTVAAAASLGPKACRQRRTRHHPPALGATFASVLSTNVPSRVCTSGPVWTTAAISDSANIPSVADISPIRLIEVTTA